MIILSIKTKSWQVATLKNIYKLVIKVTTHFCLLLNCQSRDLPVYFWIVLHFLAIITSKKKTAPAMIAPPPAKVTRASRVCPTESGKTSCWSDFVIDPK